MIFSSDYFILANVEADIFIFIDQLHLCLKRLTSKLIFNIRSNHIKLKKIHVYKQENM